MKRKLSVFVLMLVLVLSGCSILPEDSPIILDGDVIDRRNVHEGQIRTRTEAFLEMLGNR